MTIKESLKVEEPWDSAPDTWSGVEMALVCLEVEEEDEGVGMFEIN